MSTCIQTNTVRLWNHFQCSTRVVLLPDYFHRQKIVWLTRSTYLRVQCMHTYSSGQSRPSYLLACVEEENKYGGRSLNVFSVPGDEGFFFLSAQNCINQFTVLAQSERCRFIGNVCFGKDVSLTQLRPYYHAVVMVCVCVCVCYRYIHCICQNDSNVCIPCRPMEQKMTEYWVYLVRYINHMHVCTCNYSSHAFDALSIVCQQSCQKGKEHVLRFRI